MDQMPARTAHLRDAPPRSVSGGFTVGAALGGIAAGSAVVFRLRPDDDPNVSALVMMAFLALPCALVEVLIHRSPQASGLRFAGAGFSVARAARKLAALWTILAVLAAAYHALPVYEADVYAPFHWLLREFGWVFVLLSIPYVAVVDALQREPEDALWSLGEGLVSLSPRLGRREVNHLLGWLVKGFYLPLMFSYLAGQIADLRGLELSDDADRVSHLYDLAYSGIFLVDLIVATAGYTFTLRLLGTEIRSVEPTLKGWLVALVCYEPFWGLAYGSYLAYGHDRPWGSWLASHPVVYTLWAAAIIALLAVYGWAALSFGLRFSNLTHRGIITSGPFRWTKHPAYLSKNASWWLISIPFLPPDGSVWSALKLCTLLGLVNGIYYLRAKTEERHLSQDPVYRSYAEYVRRRGIFRFWRSSPRPTDGNRVEP